MKMIKCEVCGEMVPMTLVKPTVHGTAGGWCPGSEIFCLSPKNVKDLEEQGIDLETGERKPKHD